jgi:serine/threonine-protein kinase
MGVVYLATDERLKRRVALKLIAPEHAADPRFRERFLRESELAASLDHSHVVPVYAAGETEGQLWIAMRYVQGTDLRTLLEQDGPLEPERSSQLVAQVASALDAAHAIGLVHRDVKPANVLVTEEDGTEHCYLSDFGLARSPEAAGDPTGAHLSGTVDYTAPEQIAREPADHRADVYSLGCVLYECLCGKPPFKRPRAVATLFAHASEPPPSLHERRPELPEAIDDVIAKALAKDPEERYETCGDLVQAARQALGLDAPRFTRRHLVLAGTGAALAVAAAAAIPAVLLSRDEEAAARRPILPLTDTSLVRIDPDSAELVAAVELGGAPIDVATGLGSVWVADPREKTLKEIDPRTNALSRTIDLAQAGAPTGIAIGGGFVWIYAYGETINERRTWTLEPRSGSLSFFADEEVSEPDSHSVWMSNDKEEVDTTVRVDIESGRVLEASRIPRWSSVVTSGHDRESTWAVYQEATSLVRRLDFHTGDFVAEIEVGPVETILVEDGQVWVATNDGSVVRIDPATNQVADRIEVTRSPKQLIRGNGSLWVADARDPVIARVDPQTGDVVTIRVGGTPLSMAFGEGGLWVIVRPS